MWICVSGEDCLVLLQFSEGEPGAGLTCQSHVCWCELSNFILREGIGLLEPRLLQLNDREWAEKTYWEPDALSLRLPGHSKQTSQQKTLGSRGILMDGLEAFCSLVEQKLIQRIDRWLVWEVPTLLISYSTNLLLVHLRDTFAVDWEQSGVYVALANIHYSFGVAIVLLMLGAHWVETDWRDAISL